MVTSTEEDRLMTVEEVAEYTGLASSTVRRYASEGKIPSVKLGPTKQSPLRFWRSEITEWIESYREDR